MEYKRVTLESHIFYQSPFSLRGIKHIYIFKQQLSFYYGPGFLLIVLSTKA